jgi:hypothetical protein
LLAQAQAIVGAGGPPTAAERDRLARLSQILAVPIEKPAALKKPGPAPTGKTTTRPRTVSH